MAEEDTAPLARISLSSALDSDRGEHDSSLPITEFLGDATAGAVDLFRAKHGAYFLVRWTVDGRFTPPAPLGSENWRKHTNIVPNPNGMIRPLSEGSRATSFFAYPLRFDQRCVLQIGRAHTSDVCIADMSVSTIHAEIELDDDGRVQITDRGSTNGTKIGSIEIGFGNSATVESGKTVHFGNVALTFMPADAFISFVQVMSQR